MDINSVMRKPKIHITEVRNPEKREWTEALSNNGKNFPELKKNVSYEI